MLPVRREHHVTYAAVKVAISTDHRLQLFLQHDHLKLQMIKNIPPVYQKKQEFFGKTFSQLYSVMQIFW